MAISWPGHSTEPAASLRNEPDTFYEGKSLEMILLTLLSVTRFNKSSMRIVDGGYGYEKSMLWIILGIR